MDEKYTIAIAGDIQEKIKILGGGGRGGTLCGFLYIQARVPAEVHSNVILLTTKTRFPDM